MTKILQVARMLALVFGLASHTIPFGHPGTTND